MNEREIFEQAIQITGEAARQEFVDRACQGDFSLRKRIEDLLSSHTEASGFLQVPAVEQLKPVDSRDQPTLQLPPGTGCDDENADELNVASDISFLKPSTKPGSIGVLGHYEILQILGQGAFGIVFKAFDEKLHRHVAIKVMNPQMAATSPPRKRFLREARAAAAIRHDNVTQVYSVEEDPIPYLVMEYIDGVTLSNKLDAIGPLEVPELLHLGKQIALGLSAAHEKGLVHRDIKPGNILLEKGAEQKVKITDFGLARAADDASLTQSGLIAGTPLYMAPEQALGQSLDGRTDLFSFGSVLYQMACGRPPFRAPSTVAVLRRVVDDQQRPLREVIPEIPEWFEVIVNKLLSKKADDRYQSAKEVADLLTRCQSELQLTGEISSIPEAGTKSDRSHRASNSESEGRQTADSVNKSNPSPASGREASVETDPKTTHLGRKAIIAIVALTAIVLAGLYFPILRLQLAGKAQFRNLTRDGTTRIEFLREGKLIRERVGFGDIELPAGEYEIRITNPDPHLVLYNALLGYRPIIGSTRQTTLSSAPQQLTLVAGDRIDFTVGFTREDIASDKDQGANGSGWHGWPADAPKPAIAPFTAEQAKQHQEEWAAYLKVPVEFTNSIGMKFRLIPPGEFLMGSTAEEIAVVLKDAISNDQHFRECTQSEGPQRKVLLTHASYLGIYEVTQKEYAAVMGANPSHFSGTGAGKETVANLDLQNYPVETVSWNDAAEFCAKLSRRDNLKPFYLRSEEIIASLDGTGYRLPSEAEWEFACRAGTATKYWIGDKDEDLVQAGWFGKNSGGKTHAVGELKANPFGLADCYGNVWEWVQDRWDASHDGELSEKPVINPIPPFSAGSQRLI